MKSGGVTDESAPQSVTRNGETAGGSARYVVPRHLVGNLGVVALMFIQS